MTGQLWFVLSNGGEFGPLSEAEVTALISQNVVSQNAMVSVDRVNWQMLQHVFGEPQESVASATPVYPYTPPPPVAPPQPTSFTSGPSYQKTAKKPPNRSQMLFWLSSIGFLGALTSWCLGLFAFPLAVLAPISWWMAANELAAVRRGQLSPKGTDTLQVAVTNGLLGTIVFGVWLTIFALAIAAGATQELSK